MMIQLPLLFHFNQHLNEFAKLASQVCYRGLIQTLRQYPAVKANIHISGTLITALKWLDPKPLELIQEGLADGQFEMVGSTFAQNVIYATDEWDNARQIDLHKQVIEETFGVTPTAFWIPERCWRQSLVPLIANEGYQTITIEDHILEQSGGYQEVVYRTRLGDHSLNILRDDEKLKHLFNFAAWFGKTNPLFAYLDQLPNDKVNIIAYAEDAEAMGLWGYFQGIDPRQTWARLGVLLKELAGRDDLKTILFSNIPEPGEEISPIADGSAAWMDASLARAGLPYHEDGFENWFDFNANSPKLAKFREFYGEIRRRLQGSEIAKKKKAATQIAQLALHAYLTHQYEFGCIGIGGDKYRGWMGANSALVLNSVTSLATLPKRRTEPIQFPIVDETTRDTQDEWIHLYDPNLLITTPTGGRLLYWINLKNGQMRVGNPSAVVPGKYEGGSIPPIPSNHPAFWLPEVDTPLTIDQPEEQPTRMAKFLPGWVWEQDNGPVSLAVREMRIEGEVPSLNAQQGAFCDEIWVNETLVHTRRDSMEVKGSPKAIQFSKTLGDRITVQKKYTAYKETITVKYTFLNLGKRTYKLCMTTTSELVLDYAEILQHGRAALDFLPNQAGVVNPRTRESLTLIPSIPPSEEFRTPGMLALNIGLGFEFSHAAGDTKVIEIRLTKGRKRK